MISMESVNSESNVSYGWNNRSSESVSKENYGGESVSYQAPTINSPRIRQLKRELDELRQELELSKQIADVKEKIKKYK
jgi:hypothetical protein